MTNHFNDFLIKLNRPTQYNIVVTVTKNPYFKINFKWFSVYWFSDVYVLLQKVKENLNPASSNYRTAIVALGHIAYNLPERYPIHIKNLVSRKVSYQ